MKRKERYIATLNEVTITRDGDYAWIAYKEEGIAGTRLQIGPEIAEISDSEILGCLWTLLILGLSWA
jgi:hypothetical protein